MILLDTHIWVWWADGSPALAAPGVVLVDLTPRIATASTTLPGSFHKDPADQLLVATARVHEIPFLTVDRRIREYPHVRLL